MSFNLTLSRIVISCTLSFIGTDVSAEFSKMKFMGEINNHSFKVKKGIMLFSW